VRAAKERQPDLVLLDLSVPTMDGHDDQEPSSERSHCGFSLYSDRLGQLLARAAKVDLVISNSDGAAEGPLG
jgi:hypothetical protein